MASLQLHNLSSIFNLHPLHLHHHHRSRHDLYRKVQLQNSRKNPSALLHARHIIGGPNPTAIKVVSIPTNASLSTFGVITAIADPPTEVPAQTSELLGRAQCPYSYHCRGRATLNFVYVEGKYNGSTLAVVARDDVFEEARELPSPAGFSWPGGARC